MCPISSGNNPFYVVFKFTQYVFKYLFIDYKYKNIKGFANKASINYEINHNSNPSAYLTGLVEGDGSIAVHDPKSKSKKYTPKFIIVFKRSDLPLANYLCQLTGCGKVFDKPERGAL